MEPVGFAVGIISLAGLFDACIDLANCVRLASNLGRDYEATYTKFLLLKGRLSAWHPCLKVFDAGDIIGIREHDLWVKDRLLVSRSLTAIKQSLEDAQKLELRYGLRQIESGGSRSEPTAQISEAMKEVEQVLDSAAKHRQESVSWRKKCIWAIKDKKSFDDLIDELAFHVNELEKLAARWNQSSAMDTFAQSIRTITSPGAVQLLVDTTTAPDSIQTASVAPGHRFICNQVAEQARAILGNVGEVESSDRAHIYQGNQVIGNGRVIMGNASGDVLRDFWRA